MAEGVFYSLVKEAGLESRFEIDSAGTGSWHVGEKPHRGTRRVLADNGIQYDHRARQVMRDELAGWHYVIAMDASNLNNLQRMMDSFGGELGLLLGYAPEVAERDVPDPYYNGRFEEVFELVEKGCRGLLNHIRQREAL
jgi:protein-tyrosine phosphatase